MTERTDVDGIVDRMQQTRSKNNVVWMTALRIALKAEPEKMKAVIREIAEHDREIHSLWLQLGRSRRKWWRLVIPIVTGVAVGIAVRNRP